MRALLVPPPVISVARGVSMIQRIALTCAVILLATVASAQTHPCDQTIATSGTGVAGTAAQLVHCHSGLDANGNTVTGFVVYDNGARTSVPMVRGTSPNSAGLYEFASPFTIPSTPGVHTLETAALSGTVESGKSIPFVLTVSLPRVAPAAPVKTHVR